MAERPEADHTSAASGGPGVAAVLATGPADSPVPSKRGRPARWVHLLLVSIAISAYCTLVYRQAREVNTPRNIDEAGYLSFAFNNALSWQNGGGAAWLRTVLYPSAFPPVVPASLSVALVAVKASSQLALPVMLAWSALALGGVAALAAGLRRPPIIYLSLALVASTTFFVLYSSVVMFAVPVTAVTTWALVCLQRSQALTRIPLALGYGALVGLMPLTRTMTISFVPGLALAGLVVALLGPNRRRSLIGWALAAITATTVAATWLKGSWRPVLDYLTDYGYGKHEDEYSHGHWLSELANELRSGLTDLQAAILLTGLGLAVLCAIAMLARSGDRRAALASRTGTTLLACLITLVFGLAALFSSSNNGSGFTLPLLPPVVVIAAWGIVRTLAAVRSPAAVTYALVTALAVGSFQHSSHAIPDSARYFNGGIESADWIGATAWNQASAELAEVLTREPLPAGTNIFFGFRGTAVNVNTVSLAAMEFRATVLPMGQIDPLVMPDEASLGNWLDSSTHCFLLTSEGTIDEFEPVADTAALVRAATARGFQSDQVVSMPNGRTVQVWRGPVCQGG
ncbi:MAG: hypothetical protein ACOYEV_00060 [Candidatus Nanopelagicales bacterium]